MLTSSSSSQGNDTEHKLNNKLINGLDLKKATCPDKISVTVFKNISPELSPNLEKMFNLLKGEILP